MFWITLKAIGIIAVVNLQWLTEEQWVSKTKTELQVYGGHGISPGCP